MSDQREQDGQHGQHAPDAWERRRRLAEVFGDTEPETTSDERDEGGARRESGESSGDRWLREQVPPHHGGE